MCFQLLKKKKLEHNFRSTIDLIHLLFTGRVHSLIMFQRKEILTSSMKYKCSLLCKENFDVLMSKLKRARELEPKKCAHSYKPERTYYSDQELKGTYMVHIYNYFKVIIYIIMDMNRPKYPSEFVFPRFVNIICLQHDFSLCVD